MEDCTISDDWTYKGMRVVYMENSILRIGILVDRGSDVFEFTYKPLAIDPLLRLSKGIKNPARDFSQMRDTSTQFEDYYYGGWQEILPNSPSFDYRGAVLGQHGEVSLIPWKYAIIKNSNAEIALKVWTEPLRIPLRIEKTFILKKGEATVYISEQLTNLGKTELDIMWGHHIAFGLPFLDDGAIIESNAKTFRAEETMPSERRFKAGKEFIWPEGEGLDGRKDDASIIPDAEAKPYSDLCYLSGYTDDAFYTFKSKKYGIGFQLNWDGNVFKHLWLWQERFATKEFPWWGQCYTIALEPWTSVRTANPGEAIQKGEWLRLDAGQVIETQLSASIV